MQTAQRADDFRPTTLHAPPRDIHATDADAPDAAIGARLKRLAAALAEAERRALIFRTLHRLLARGGMIDARHLNPLACGINLAIAALILSPHVIPY